MIDIPPAIIEYAQNIDINSVIESANQYRYIWDAVSSVWTKETLWELINGNLAVPDSAVNEALAQHIQNHPEGNIKSIVVSSHENGRMDILADTNSVGKIEVSGTIEKFVHNENESSMSYKVHERALKDHGLLSWFVSRIPLSMAQGIFGRLDVSEDIPVAIDGNTLTVDFREIISKSMLAEKNINGHPLLYMVEIEEAVPKEGYIAFKTKVNIPGDVKDLLIDSIVNKNNSER